MMGVSCLAQFVSSSTRLYLVFLTLFLLYLLVFLKFSLAAMLLSNHQIGLRVKEVRWAWANLYALHCCLSNESLSKGLLSSEVEKLQASA